MFSLFHFSIPLATPSSIMALFSILYRPCFSYICGCICFLQLVAGCLTAVGGCLWYGLIKDKWATMGSMNDGKDYKPVTIDDPPDAAIAK
jgi:hypothetical protein